MEPALRPLNTYLHLPLEFGQSLTGTHLLSSVSITCPPGQSQPAVHRAMHPSSFTLSQVNVQGLAQVEYT